MMTSVTNDLLSNLLGESASIVNRRVLTGGSINHCELLSLADGRKLFSKTLGRSPLPGMYAAEYTALESLAAPAIVDVPRPLYCDENILLTEAFIEGAPAPDWQEQMGRGLALLHHKTRQARFGFDCDNYLGTTFQDNRWQDDWLVFWREQRLEHQLRLYRNQTSPADPLLKAGKTLLERLDDILLCEPEPAVLLHGDLWSGNVAANEKGEPVIYDPASYFGHREAEFGMMRLFGGFTMECEAAYQEVWPFQPGHDRRIEVYRLYHQLNHLNLFGQGYYQGCLSTIRRLI